MSKKFKIFLIFAIIISVIGYVTLDYILNGGERNLDSEQPLFAVNSKVLTNEFGANLDLANKKYLEKAIAVTGVVTAVENHEIIIDNIIICNFKIINNSLKVEQNVTIKGRFVGFDDLMGEFKLDHCSVNKP